MLASEPKDSNVGPADAAPLAGDNPPGDTAESSTSVGADASARTESARHGWHVLAILSALMGFASISTDPTCPRCLRWAGCSAPTRARSN